MERTGWQLTLSTLLKVQKGQIKTLNYFCTTTLSYLSSFTWEHSTLLPFQPYQFLVTTIKMSCYIQRAADACNNFPIGTSTTTQIQSHWDKRGVMG